MQKRPGMRSSRAAATLPPPSSTADVAGVITLDQVRPQPRKQNDYVDTPRAISQPGVHGLPLAGGNTPPVQQRVLLPKNVNRPLSSPPQLTTIISQQPVSTSPPLKKPQADKEDSIICSQCGKCKCGACTEPQNLPSRWVCSGKMNLSAENCVEYTTCFCCVRGVFYHCNKDDQDAEYECYNDPCACCAGRHCFKRWSCILMMGLCLPCLACYWPAHGCVAACTACYNKCRQKGCTCNKNPPKTKSKGRGIVERDSNSQTRRLLPIITNESESSSTS